MLSLIYDWVYVLFQKCSKVQHFKEFIPKAFPTGDDLILDAEVLLVDNKTSKPLPFGTLGVHKVRFFFPGFLLFLMGRGLWTWNYFSKLFMYMY